MEHYLAIDIGASSGRHIVGWLEGGELKTEEIYRFPNGVTELDGHLTWDIDALLGHVKKGIAIAKEKYPRIESLSVDTWGVDYVLLRGDEEIRPCCAYRDSRTEAVIPQVHEKISFTRLYRHTGIQFQPFNTIYQLCADQEAGRLEDVTDFLMIPEYLMYKLCGVKSHEYTNATTGGMVSAETREFDPAIIEALGLPQHLFCKLQQPGAVIGEYEGIKVVLCATHDTGSAVEGIPMAEDAPYISSGTWSLLGVKTERPITDAASELANWSNEGGVGYNRYQKNIMGMWLVNRLRSELCPDKPWSEITAEAEKSRFEETVDANAQGFLAPESMKAAFDAALSGKPETVGDYFRCAYKSLALSYRDAVNELERNTGRQYDCIYIVGGGTVEKVWDMAKYVVAFERWVKDEQLGFVASHYDGFAQGVAGKLDSMLIPAFSMLIKQGTACAVEGDIKVAMAMSILKTISGMGQLSEMYSIDFNEDICIIGHSGSGDADISKAKKPTMKIVPVFHGKTGGGYLTQFYPAEGPVTYLGITQDRDGHFKFVVAEGVNEPGPIFTFGDTNMRTRFTCGAREFCNKWSEAGPTHHMAAASGRWIDTILKVAKIFNVPVDIVTR